MSAIVGLAFLAGLITVLSPCVFPLLPVIFATSAQEGRARPAGVLAGFVGSFSAATLTLSFLVRSLGLSPDLNRVLAGTVLLAMGLVLAIPYLHGAFERIAGVALGRVQAPRAGRPGNGFAGGIAVGTGLGLAWSPCVGPIMASVVTLALNQEIDLGAVAVTLAFSLGTAIPMGAVILGGRQLVIRLGPAQANSVRLQRMFGVVLLITGIAIFSGYDRAVQGQLLTWFPDWEQALTGWEPNLPAR